MLVKNTCIGFATGNFCIGEMSVFISTIFFFISTHACVCVCDEMDGFGIVSLCGLCTNLLMNEFWFVTQMKKRGMSSREREREGGGRGENFDNIIVNYCQKSKPSGKLK